MTIKTCKQCGRTKGLRQFDRHPQCKQGRRPECSVCRKAYLARTIAVRREQWRGYRRKAKERDWAGYVLSSVRTSAVRRGLSFALTRLDLPDPLPEKCPVLGIPLVYGMNSRENRFASPSLDRINSALGYIPGNVVVVSWRANSLKKDATPTELRALADYYAETP